MKFIPNATMKEVLLKEIGLATVDELFSDIPSEIKIKELHLPKGISQQETEQHLRTLAKKNISCQTFISFLGGGIKPHYVPAVVKAIAARTEFYTAYTPYQPEASQGFLQAMFEYQSMIAEITGMDIANCSLYDGATALGEAALMCTRINRKKTFLIPQNLSWEKKSVLLNYSRGPGIKIKEIPYDKEKGTLDVTSLKRIITDNVSGVYLENPNFFGVFEDEVEQIGEIVKDAKALFVVGVDPLSLGIVKNPGEYGADIVIGEGRALGNPMDFGGSSIGIFACKDDYVRQIPGRLIGMTTDAEGKRAFCMTLQTREQHIRRGKATSNICTNEGLNALIAVVYLAWLGGDGLREVGRKNFENGQKFLEYITRVDGFKKVFGGVHFNEFVIQYTGEVVSLNKHLLTQGVHGGLILDQWYPEMKNCMLFGVTEIHDEQDMKQFVRLLEEASNV